jgi:hypothetical protein
MASTGSADDNRRNVGRAFTVDIVASRAGTQTDATGSLRCSDAGANATE